MTSKKKSKNDSIAKSISTLELHYFSPYIKDNKELLLKTIKQNALAIRYANSELKNNKEVVLEAVKEAGCSLKYASEELKNNKEVVLKAIKQDCEALSFSSEKLRCNKEFLYEIKEILLKSKEYYKKEYEMLLKYEREDELNKHLEKKEININKIKKKI